MNGVDQNQKDPTHQNRTMGHCDFLFSIIISLGDICLWNMFHETVVDKDDNLVYMFTVSCHSRRNNCEAINNGCDFWMMFAVNPEAGDGVFVTVGRV